MNENFLLKSPLSSELFHETAENLPIIDFHNHLNIKTLIDNSNFCNLCELWIDSDPYKHRAMRIAGIPEHLITGKDTDPWERFLAWATVLPQTVGNPLYHWSMLELQRVFDWQKPLCADNAKALWDHANQRLQAPEFSPLGLLRKFHVKTAFPCMGLHENAAVFTTLQQTSIHLAPSLRGDDLLTLSPKGIAELEKTTHCTIRDLDDLKQALALRIDFFHLSGCRFADHALDGNFHYQRDDGGNVSRFHALAAGQQLSQPERDALNSELLRHAASLYAKAGWLLQLHIGAERYTSSRLRKSAGPAGGFAGIAHPCDVAGLCTMLDDFEQAKSLPQTVLYTLNPADNAALAVLTGSFCEDNVPGKLQFGPAWWYNDHLSGMRQHWEALSSFGLFSTFLGMTTDSRSLLSFVRHEYFRRALSEYVAEKVERDEFPDDSRLLHQLIYNLCYGNISKILERIEK